LVEWARQRRVETGAPAQGPGRHAAPVVEVRGAPAPSLETPAPVQGAGPPSHSDTLEQLFGAVLDPFEHLL
jgi:hypothetical protein